MTEKRVSKNIKDHLANERTYLAWIRTALGIMAFGFVVEKFSFFIQQIALFLKKSGVPEAGPTTPTALQGYSSLFGISLVAVGALLCLFSFFKFKKTERQIDKDNYQSSLLLDTLLMVFVFFIGVFLLIYLIKSHHALNLSPE